ncbi:RNA polymerase III subunit RPC82 family protein [Tasmannia lanceolata]|uniref:RNA polymerase III subunit RPC82 family protein n=1 Tax=Tasmannia lanceolata TaxID=3420 RepID=UPI004062E560
MVAQYGLEFAVHIITSHFGDLVAKVCSCLLHRGSLTLQDIARYTELQPAQIKNCLLVLIQHNCVQAFSVERQSGFGVAPKVFTMYMALFDSIVHRTRFTKFLAIAKEQLDEKCEGLLEGLLHHGRLTLEQIILRAMSKKTKGNAAALRDSFVSLVHEHFVERCPIPEPFVVPSPKSASTGRRGAKSAQVIETIEQLAITAATPSEAERFYIISDIVEGNPLDEKEKEHTFSIKVGEKRKHGALEIDQETVAAISEKEILWRANFEEFVRCLRHKACVANVRSRLGVHAGTVLEAILGTTKHVEKKVKEEKSVQLSMDTILEEVRKRKGGLELSLNHVRDSLDQLGCHSCMEEEEGLYSIGLRKIIEVARNDEAESIVLRRYGREAYRIFRLLAKNGSMVETDKISEMTMIERKDTVKILYKLWKDDYLHMEKLVSHPSKQAPFLLWKVKGTSLWELVLNDMYHAALNLSLRTAYELDQEHEVLELPQNLRDGAQEKKFERLRNVTLVLETSLLKLDDALLLFHNF